MHIALPTPLPRKEDTQWEMSFLDRKRKWEIYPFLPQQPGTGHALHDYLYIVQQTLPSQGLITAKVSCSFVVGYEQAFCLQPGALLSFIWELLVSCCGMRIEGRWRHSSS